jgi:hypothetical protein
MPVPVFLAATVAHPVRINAQKTTVENQKFDLCRSMFIKLIFLLLASLLRARLGPNPGDVD